MADALTGLTEIDISIEDVVSGELQLVLIATMVAVPTIMDKSSEVRPGMDTLKITRYDSFAVSSKVSGTPVDAVTKTLASDNLVLDKHKVVQFLVEDIANLQAKVGFVQDWTESIGRSLAAEMDQTVITAMEAAPSAAAPDHILDFDNTPADTLSKGDFLNAAALLDAQNVPDADRFCLVNPSRHAELLAISEFVRVDESGGSEALRNGRIGKLFGFDVMKSAQSSADATLFYHKTTAAFARQMSPRVQRESDLPNLAGRWSVDHLYGVIALDQGLRSVKIKDTGI